MSVGIVKVQTWGTDAQNGKGIKNFIAAQYRDENVGHASVELVVPASGDNKKMVAYYCDKAPAIPVSLKEVMNDKGQLEEVLVVRFSFIPTEDSESSPFYLQRSYREDTEYELSGHNTTARHYLETSELVNRKSGTRVIRLFPPCSLTAKGRALDFTSPKGAYVLNLKQQAELQDIKNTIAVLRSKTQDIYNKMQEKSSFMVDIFKKQHLTLRLAAARVGIELPKSGKIDLQELKRKSVAADLEASIDERLLDLQIKAQEIKNTMDDAPKKADYEKSVRSLLAVAQLLHSKLKVGQNKNTRERVIKTSFNRVKLDSSVLEKVESLLSVFEEDGKDFSVKKESLMKGFGNLISEFNSKIEQLPNEGARLQNSIEEYLCFGRPADAEIQLPADDNTLNIRAMLAQMREIASSGHEYKIVAHNCSTTVLSILEAGKSGEVKPVSKPLLLSKTNPQTVYNEAMAIRARMCPISVNQSFKKLDQFFTEHLPSNGHLVEENYQTVHEAVLQFAVNTVFPDDYEVQQHRFHTFSKRDRAALLHNENKQIPTHLLRDLWNIIPQRTLPLKSDKAYNILIDKNMTVGELVQGLSILAQQKAQQRLLISKEDKKLKSADITSSAKPLYDNPYTQLKNKIQEEIIRISKKNNTFAQKKAIKLQHYYTNIVEELDTEKPQKSPYDKADILLKEISPVLKMNMGLGVKKATSYTQVKKFAYKLGIKGSGELHTKFQTYKEKLRTTKNEDINADKNTTIDNNGNASQPGS